MQFRGLEGEKTFPGKNFGLGGQGSIGQAAPCKLWLNGFLPEEGKPPSNLG